MAEKKVIKFYREKDDYGEFSNFFPRPITVDGEEYSTSEHYFQAMKYHKNPEYFEKIKNAKTPNECAKLGRSRDHPLRPDWEDVKDDIMRTAIRAKFTQHEDLKKVLLDTEDTELVESTWRDSYWADGGDGKGKNMLGKLLMELREELLMKLRE